MNLGRRFELLLDAYRRPDGSKWTGQELDDATNGVVSRSYVTNLRKGRIESPGFEKLRAIAKAMGFPPELWFEEALDVGGARQAGSENGRSLAERVERLFEANKNERTGERYTNAEVARMSLGELTEQDVERIRTGAVANPPVGQVVALADVFGVHPSYFLDTGKKPPLIDAEALEILRDETVSAIAHKSLHLPPRDRQMILNIIRQFEDMRETDESDDAMPESSG